MKKWIAIFCFFYSIGVVAQSDLNFALVDAKMSKIPVNSTTTPAKIAHFIKANFASESDQIRAAYYWVATTIQYDIANIDQIDFAASSGQKIENTLTTKKGVCIHYAEVFNAIVLDLGFESYIVPGYTKQNGKVGIVSHVWCAVKSNNEWQLFDPTWGSGAINGGKFIKKLNNFYFKTKPIQLLKTHIPFDYIWQLLKNPVSNREFVSGISKASNSLKSVDWEKEIKLLKNKKPEDKLFEEIGRIEANGVVTQLIQDYLLYKKRALNTLRQKNSVEQFNLIVAECNKAVVEFNEFNAYKNKKFKPALPDEVLKKMVQSPKEKLLMCKKGMETLGSLDQHNAFAVIVADFAENLNTMLAQILEQERFVDEYVGKSKMARKTMFGKSTWSVVPLH